MIAFGITILIISLANLVFNAVLLFHLGRLVAFIPKEPSSLVTETLQPPQFIQVKRPGKVPEITEDAGKKARKDKQNLVSLDDVSVEEAIKAVEDWAK